MNIVLLESLGIAPEQLAAHAEKLASMGHTLTVYERCTDSAVIAGRCRDADAVILANMPLSEACFEGCEHLRYVDIAFTGVDHVPMDYFRARRIRVSNASGYATEAVAELCIGYMIALLRQSKTAEERCRQGGTKEGLTGHLLRYQTVGIVGAGAIGERVAELCKAFGCRVVCHNRSLVLSQAFDDQLPLEELLPRCDIVSLHVPLTDKTRGMIGREQLALMKPSALLLNTARGGVVDTEAVAEALNSGALGGYAADVFETEPPLADHPLFHTPNTIVTPHMGFASAESMAMRAEIVFENLYAWLEGTILNEVK